MKLFVFLLLLLVSLINPLPAWADDTVVLLHGIGRTSKSMKPLEKFLSEKGYQVLNIDYLSREKSLDALVEDIHNRVKGVGLKKGEIIHFVGYSLGGLLVRAYLRKHRPYALGSVVMLGTPNKGSEVADFLKGNLLYNSFYGPAGQELSTDQSQMYEILGPVDFELGVIAGDRSIDPMSSQVIPGSDDGKVSVERTKIEGMKDHIVLHVTHTFMMSNPAVMRQTEHFLKYGKFERQQE